MEFFWIRKFLLLFITLFVVVIHTVTGKSLASSEKDDASSRDDKVDHKNETVSPALMTRKLVLDRGTNFELGWSSSEDSNNIIIFELSASTNGYLAIGFSKDGSMRESDLILGWVDAEGRAQVKDMHGIGNTRPVVDQVQNYEVISGDEVEGRTRIMFKRRWVNCDTKNDADLADESLKIIWAISEHDPWRSDDDVFRPPYHFMTRGMWHGNEGTIKIPQGLQTLSNEQC